MNQEGTAGFLQKSLRVFAALLDAAVYTFIIFIFKIFFAVSSATILSGDTIKNFYGRVQIILGVFMIFIIAISLLQGIVNPDSLTDKSKGFSKIIVRVITALTMLMLIIPINIPEAALNKADGEVTYLYYENETVSEGEGVLNQGSYNSQLNNNGILFGTLYFIQDVMLRNNTIGKLILGTDGRVITSGKQQSGDLEKIAEDFAGIVLKGFVAINLTEDGEKAEGGELKKENRMCPNMNERAFKAYTLNKASVMLSYVSTETCEKDGEEKFAFAYLPFISTAAGILFAAILLSFTVEVAIRAIKLALLRLIAPIPIISYMNPNDKNGGSFGTWIKITMSTFLDLFIRLATLYFVIYIISDISENGVAMNEVKGIIGKLALVMIFIGMFLFAKEAPKFIKNVLGIKDDGNGHGLLKGLGAIAGAGAIGLGVIGAARTGYKASKAENPDRNFLQNGFSGFTNALAGGFAGGKAALSSKDHITSNVIKAMNANNAARSSYSTGFGRMIDQGRSLLTGESAAAADTRTLEAANTASDRLKKYKGMLQEEARKNGKNGMLDNITGIDANGNENVGRKAFNYEKLQAALNTHDNHGNFIYRYDDGTQLQLNASDFDANTMNSLLDSQTENYMAGYYADGKTAYADNGKITTETANVQHSTKNADIAYDGSYGDIGKAIGRANEKAMELNTNPRHIANRANANQNRNK